MADKTMTEDDVVGRLEDGMTIGIGGWAARRKPMSIVRAILRSELTDLTVVSYGGPDVGMLCAAGRIRKLVFAFVSLDSVPLEPHFRAARQSGAIDADELDEGMLLLGLQAAAWRVPFLPTRVGLGSDLFATNDGLHTVTSPYPDPESGEAEELVAMPAIQLDAALVHANRADARGNVQFLGPDVYFDDLMAAAATDAYVSCERLVPTESLLDEGPIETVRIPRLEVTGVVEAVNGAHPTSCQPDYEADDPELGRYAATAKDPSAWSDYLADRLQVHEADYQAGVSR